MTPGEIQQIQQTEWEVPNLYGVIPRREKRTSRPHRSGTDCSKTHCKHEGKSSHAHRPRTHYPQVHHEDENHVGDPTLRIEGAGWRGKGPSKSTYDESGAENNFNSGYKMTFGGGNTSNDDRNLYDNHRKGNYGSGGGLDYQYNPNQSTPSFRHKDTPLLDSYQSPYKPGQFSSANSYTSGKISRVINSKLDV
ncbi:hypothetical protein NHQ30_003791 [Ciborinia camelliae]|nr:hypothetical protein NHQ30_003791 [Ciborinia camelliae]